VFAIVEDEHKAQGPKIVGNGSNQERVRLFADANKGSYGLGYNGRIGKRCQIYEPNSVREVVKQGGGYMD
jgi:hypothetical protein